MWLRMASGTAAMWMISSTVTDTLTAIVPFAGTATKWTSTSSKGCWRNAPTLSILFLQHQISLLRSVWSCEGSMTGRSRCRQQSCIVPLRWQMPRRFLSAATSLKNRWQVLCLVPILIICFAFLRSASRIWRLSFPARRAFISGWTISAMWLSFRCASRKLVHPIPLAVRPRQRTVLQSKDGTRFITASNLSSALSAVRNNKTAVAYSIRRAIGLLKASVNKSTMWKIKEWELAWYSHSIMLIISYPYRHIIPLSSVIDVLITEVQFYCQILIKNICRTD